MKTYVLKQDNSNYLNDICYKKYINNEDCETCLNFILQQYTKIHQIKCTLYVNFKVYGCCGIKDKDHFFHECPILNSNERLVITFMFKLQSTLYNYNEREKLIHMYTTYQ
jgi:hypothetical protein